MKKYTCVVIGLMVCFFLSAFSSCGGSDEATSTVTGTAYMNTAPDGVRVYVKLVARGGGSAATALYSTVSGLFSGGKATFSLTGVKNGSYTRHAFIDMNENASGDWGADYGDYVTDGGSDIEVNGDTVLDIPDVEWVTFSD